MTSSRLHPIPTRPHRPILVPSTPPLRPRPITRHQSTPKPSRIKLSPQKKSRKGTARSPSAFPTTDHPGLSLPRTDTSSPHHHPFAINTNLASRPTDDPILPQTCDKSTPTPSHPTPPPPLPNRPRYTPIAHQRTTFDVVVPRPST